MNLVAKTQNFPSALVDGSVEFFLDGSELKCLTYGEVMKFDDFPAWMIGIMSLDMRLDPVKVKSTSGSLIDKKEKIRQHIAVKFGKFDNNPDILANGQVGTAENTNRLQLKNGHITKRETEVLTLIGLGLLDKEICDRLQISQDTLRNHKDNISIKAGLVRKTALGILAYKLELVEMC